MKYKAFAEDTEIIGRSVLIMFNKEFPFSHPTVKELMIEEGLIDIHPDQWYEQQKCLNVLEKIENIHGEEAVFLIAKMMLEDINHYQVTDLESELIFLDTGYRLNHRNGDLGHFELLEYNDTKGYAIMEHHTPYPPAFDRAVIEVTARKKIRPEQQLQLSLLHTEPHEDKGVKYTYKISWNASGITGVGNASYHSLNN